MSDVAVWPSSRSRGVRGDKGAVSQNTITGNSRRHKGEGGIDDRNIQVVTVLSQEIEIFGEEEKGCSSTESESLRNLVPSISSRNS